MSNCAIPGCRNQAVAWGLCAKHYMRNADAETRTPRSSAVAR